MAYYKFNPKNHICSLVWTLFLLVTVTKETKLINGITCAALFGLPTVAVGINRRETARRDRQKQIIEAIAQQQMLTVTQTANILNISVSEARVLLGQLYRESRIEIGNRREDMAVIYTLPN